MNNYNNYKKYLINKGYAKRTITEHQSILKDFEQYLEQENVSIAATTYNDVTAYITKLRNQGLQTSTQNNRLTVLKVYFNYLLSLSQENNSDQLKDNPALDVKVNSKQTSIITNILTESSLEALYDTFCNYEGQYPKRDKQAHIKHCVALGLIIYQALSLNELNRLLVTDFQLQQGVITIPESSRSNERILKLEAKQLYLLTIYTNSKQGEKLFDGLTRGILETLTKKLQRITTDSYTIKQLRTSRIMLWLKQYGIRKAQYNCGFRYISSLEKYSVNEVEELRKKLEQFLN